MLRSQPSGYAKDKSKYRSKVINLRAKRPLLFFSRPLPAHGYVWFWLYVVYVMRSFVKKMYALTNQTCINLFLLQYSNLLCIYFLER